MGLTSRRENRRNKRIKRKAVEDVIRKVAEGFDPDSNPWTFEHNVFIYLDQLFTLTWKQNDTARDTKNRLEAK